MAIKSKPAWRGWLTSLAIATTVALSGCADDGSDGATGPAGPTGPGGTTSEIPETVDASINRATVAEDGTLTVDFEVNSGQGFGFVGLQPGDVRFTVAKLIPAGATGDGESSRWQSYINDVEAAPTGSVPGTGTEDKLQAEAERGSAGTFVDNGDGTYSYTLATNLKEVNDPIAVAYEPNLTHRVAIQLGGGLPAANPIYDWQPVDGATTNINNRRIVSEETCNNCHGQLAFHGGGRIDTDYCVTCHNPGTADANSGNTVDFKVMIHKIHYGSNLPSVQAGGEYVIYGFRNSKHDYSEVVFPQDTRNCDSCHADLGLDQEDNWREFPTAQACGSCHDDVNFETGAGHAAGAQPNSECATCHGVNGPIPVTASHTAVMAAEEELRDAIVVNPQSLTVSGGEVSVVVEITVEGQAVDSIPTAKLEPVRGVQGAVAINWSDGTGFQVNHQEVALAACAANGGGLFTCTASAADMTAVLDSDTISASDIITVTTVDLQACYDANPANISASTLVDCSSELKDGEVDITPVIATFQGDGTELSTATSGYDRVGADISSCRSCHADLTFHHAATDLVQCKTCHNATRVGFRGLGDLKRHVHRFHQNAEYPGDIENCTACHTESQINVPPQENDRASIASDGLGGEVFISPTAVVCGSCHLNANLGQIDPNATTTGFIDPTTGSSPLTAEEQAVVRHMVDDGGAVFHAATFDEANNAIETCGICHAPGSIAGVNTVHELR